MDDDNPTLLGKGRGRAWAGELQGHMSYDILEYVTTNDTQTLESNGSTDESDWSMMKNRATLN